MTGEELKQAALQLFGDKGWVNTLAERLGVDRTQVWRYVNGNTPVPGPVAAAVTCWLEHRKSPPPLSGTAGGIGER